jgi:tripartite-type tricarboxylate transporter receptor subunit TctC
MFNNPTQSLQHIRSGKLRGLATTGLKRMPQAPELPTVAESGFPGYDVGTWFALWAPAGTPSAVVEKITGAVARISAMDDVRKQLDENGLVVIGSTSAELAAYQKSEFELWGKLIRDTGIKLD